jgi:hypothetical protein
MFITTSTRPPGGGAYRVSFSPVSDAVSAAQIRKTCYMESKARLKSDDRASTVRWRSVALPAEHGGWSFVGEPLLLGLLLAPGVGGFALAVAAMGAFLLRQPLKLWVKGRATPRTLAARRFALLYGAVTVIASVATLLLLPSYDALLPLLFALPVLAVQLTYDLRNQSRAAAAEIAGALATGALAASIVLMQDWSMAAALGLWLTLAAKAVTAVLYVRARLRLERGKPAGLRTAVGAHGAACALLLGAAFYGLIPWTAPAGLAGLTARAALGLSTRRKPRPPKIIGMQEAGYGLVFVLLIAAGYGVM